MKIKDIMTSEPVCCEGATSLREVAQMMAEFDCGCIPVVENMETKKPIGVITDRDIAVRTVAHNKNPLNMIAGEVMTDCVISVTPETDVEEACHRMEANKIRRLPVVDDRGALVGMVAQADFARQTGERLTAELVKDVSEAALATV